MTNELSGLSSSSNVRSDFEDTQIKTQPVHLKESLPKIKDAFNVSTLQQNIINSNQVSFNADSLQGFIYSSEDVDILEKDFQNRILKTPDLIQRNLLDNSKLIFFDRDDLRQAQTGRNSLRILQTHELIGRSSDSVICVGAGERERGLEGLHLAEAFDQLLRRPGMTLEYAGNRYGSDQVRNSLGKALSGKEADIWFAAVNGAVQNFIRNKIAQEEEKRRKEAAERKRDSEEVAYDQQRFEVAESDQKHKLDLYVTAKDGRISKLILFTETYLAEQRATVKAMLHKRELKALYDEKVDKHDRIQTQNLEFDKRQEENQKSNID